MLPAAEIRGKSLGSIPQVALQSSAFVETSKSFRLQPSAIKLLGALEFTNPNCLGHLGEKTHQALNYPKH